MDFFVHFLSVDGDFGRRLNAELEHATLQPHHFDDDAPVDDDALADFS
ncbi:MAG: hypothetical protein ABSA12_07270 [Verrucomicrobiia bacterium]